MHNHLGIVFVGILANTDDRDKAMDITREFMVLLGYRKDLYGGSSRGCLRPTCHFDRHICSFLCFSGQRGTIAL